MYSANVSVSPGTIEVSIKYFNATEAAYLCRFLLEFCEEYLFEELVEVLVENDPRLVSPRSELRDRDRDLARVLPR